ncbi:oxidoreductase [Prosthecomicrobium hirschii]|uniref:Protein-methionine-sulfoxide reductase catalytic subunit MsrP n=1 Tax=Prosthecodimorpha hirschii TaxID=665126 RepID=A0A0P6VFR3_9HYPH|nr:protein-methionine-sulfoxide reductase catalytic subunit MsrP [Prosthecomicrobium hirschii]KPL50887.1 oxidoreductase [Prosthecomicrobium hirschii]TPQ50511.1 protein-methionine-sulfoxide reductase catalytic subunit MsrP [Prosthecomicrobium hirschii]
MNIVKRRRWQVAESAATPEALFWDRRAVLAGFGGLAAGAALMARPARADDDPLARLLPAKRNEAFKLDRPLTPEADNASYNNFYEFGTSKSVAGAAKRLKTRPWQVTIDGLVEAPITLDFTELVQKMPLEERLYRLRCVEAWSMTIPWTGFALAELVKLAKPQSGAKYLKMQTFMDPSQSPYQRSPGYPWPYTEGLTLAEATNDLAFIAVGAYGKPLPNQHGAPLRLAVPWKYGFKSVKSIVRFTFTAERPKTFWEQLQDSEYGFWANVNPEVSHPRWSQAHERVLSTGESVPTQLYNGYAAEVAHLYKDIKGERLFM